MNGTLKQLRGSDLHGTDFHEGMAHDRSQGDFIRVPDERKGVQRDSFEPVLCGSAKRCGALVHEGGMGGGRA